MSRNPTRTKDTRPPRTGPGEKATLRGFLDHLRDAVAAKATGVPEPQVRTGGVPSGTNLLGLVKHLTAVERFNFLGEDVDDWGRTMRPTPDDTLDGVLAGYRDAIERANDVIDASPDLALPTAFTVMSRPRSSRARISVSASTAPLDAA